jgi:RNA polymerase sigma-70 factor (ECF subfamily)
LRRDAIRLARALAGLMPDEPEAAGLLALMLLSEARMPARFVGSDVVLLRDQDRTLWDRSLIDEGHTIVRRCIQRELPGPYQLQAAIQAVHCAAGTFEQTDWPQIVSLYDHLMTFTPTPVAALNRAVAIGEVDGPGAALVELDALIEHLNRYHLLHAARGTMLRHLGRFGEASAAFTRALGLAPTEADRRFLDRQISELATPDAIEHQ